MADKPVIRKPSIFRKTDEGVPEREERPAGAEPKKLKRTFYLPATHIELLQELQFAEWQRTKHRPDLSELVARAIKLLHQQTSTPS